MPPNTDASLYWLTANADVSFQRICDYLTKQGMAADRSWNDVLKAHFTKSSGRARKNQARAHGVTLPRRISVMPGPISEEDRAFGDHPTLTLSWDEAGSDLPDAPEHVLWQLGSRDYRVFLDICRHLSPLYASLSVEGWVDCAYDAVHGSVRPPSTLYCHNNLLGDDSEAFWSTYAYIEAVGDGTYGTDYLYWNPRRKGLRLIQSHPKQRNELFRAAVKRMYRMQFSGKGIGV
jgi:hypothetical protein